LFNNGDRYFYDVWEAALFFRAEEIIKDTIIND